jgi:subtilase family serine protease
MSSHTNTRFSILAVALSLPVSTLVAQSYRTIEGNLHPKAQRQYDRGPVEPSMKLGSMSLMVKRSAAQQAALDQLLLDQQDATSPRYHQWLTPEQYAEHFGGGQQDLDKLTNWLQSAGFSIKQVSRGHDFIVFSGTAAQVESAFRSPIHSFAIDGETHFANAAEPSVPQEFSHLVANFQGLDDFKPKAPKRNNRASLGKVGGGAKAAFITQQTGNTNFLAPDDLAIIYNTTSFYNSGYDGSGQILAVVGQSDVDMNDIETYRSVFNLPYNDPFKILVPGSQDPGIVNGDVIEATMDLELSGAIARNATILYVYSDNVVTSVQYVIDQALAPVMSMSYSVGCEWHFTSTQASAWESLAQKAAAEGITWLASSGDAGAAGCENQNMPYTAAITRASVVVPASLPHVTGVGGTELNEGNGNYWASRLGSNGGSALSYIPESGWNDESTILQNQLNGFSASGGGASRWFSKPAWQAGFGVPSDGARDVPDVALPASEFHDPPAIVVSGQLLPGGGTSAAAPTFAGIVALLNQYLVANHALSQAGLGHINPMLYALAQSSPAAFHDVTSGSNIVPCVTGSTQDCPNGAYGYKAGPGYDQVTGLGSVDAFHLAMAWRNATTRTPHLVITQFSASTNVRAGGPFSLNLVVTNQGYADAGAFRVEMYFTSNGDISTALSSYSLKCDATGLAVGSTFTCKGTLNLGSSVTPGTYILLGVADVNNSVGESDRSGGTAIASSGPLTVTP